MKQGTLLSRFKTIKENRRNATALRKKMNKWKAHLQQTGDDYTEVARRLLPDKDVLNKEGEYKIDVITKSSSCSRRIKIFPGLRLCLVRRKLCVHLK